jgi:hypothetical protein
MTEPKTHREANIAREGLEARVGLLQKLQWWVLGLLVAVVLGAIGINVQIGDLKSDVAVVKTNVVNINDRLARIEKTIDDIRSDGGQILSRISRLEPPPGQPALPAPAPDSIVAGFYLTDGEAKLLRELLRAPPKTAAAPKYGLWEKLPDSDVRPLPDDVTSKLVKLKGLRYALDPNNNLIALVEPSGSVVAII